MKLIAAVDNKWNIGRNGGLLFRLPADMKFFRETTSGKVVIMGRRTLDSFPGGKALPKRVNIVLTGNKDFKRENVFVCNDVESVLKKAKEYDTDDVFVIGGETIYKEFLPYCDTAYITHVNAVDDNADKKFPDLSQENGWIMTEKSETVIDNGMEINFCIYENK